MDRRTLVELIEEEKAKLSTEALKLWEELEASLYTSPEEEPTFIKRREVEIIERMDRLAEADRRIVDVLSELRAGLYESDLSERRGAPSQWHSDKGGVDHALIKDPDERGEGDHLPPMSPNEVLNRAVEQALARLREDYPTF
jgi:hypothetical protein